MFTTYKALQTSTSTCKIKKKRFLPNVFVSFISDQTDFASFWLSQQNIDRTKTQTLQYVSPSISEFQHYQAF